MTILDMTHLPPLINVLVDTSSVCLWLTLGCYPLIQEPGNLCLVHRSFRNNLMSHIGVNYFKESLIEVAKNTTLSRIQRSITILGRKEGDRVDFAKLIYPVMQVTGIFAQRLSVAHSGMDQRKAHVVMRNVAGKLSKRVNEIREKKPIALHQHLLLGLGKPSTWPLEEIDQDFWADMKMSKSKPETAVCIHDEPKDIEQKISKAFCPEGEIVFNPVLDWVKHLIFPIRGALTVEREEQFGGSKEYENYDDLEKDFVSKDLHPMDLKKSVARELIDIPAPAREHFSEGENKKLLSEMKEITITRS